jgi:hypothetical protein
MLFTGFFESAICYFMLFLRVFVVFRAGLSSLVSLPSFLGFTLICLNWSWISLDSAGLSLTGPR